MCLVLDRLPWPPCHIWSLQNPFAVKQHVFTSKWIKQERNPYVDFLGSYLREEWALGWKLHDFISLGITFTRTTRQWNVHISPGETPTSPQVEAHISSRETPTSPQVEAHISSRETPTSPQAITPSEIWTIVNGSLGETKRSLCPVRHRDLVIFWSP